MRTLAVRSAALATGAGLAMSGLAACTVPTPAAKTTFQMYANVDAEGDLGSNFDAVRAFVDTTNVYVVTFTQPVGHCAAVAQAGKAGGPDSVDFAESLVVPGNAKSFVVAFKKSSADADFVRDPFLLSVTCSR